jgi:hypothetical protein
MKDGLPTQSSAEHDNPTPADNVSESLARDWLNFALISSHVIGWQLKAAKLHRCCFYNPKAEFTKKLKWRLWSVRFVSDGWIFVGRFFRAREWFSWRWFSRGDFWHSMTSALFTSLCTRAICRPRLVWQLINGQKWLKFVKIGHCVRLWLVVLLFGALLLLFFSFIAVKLLRIFSWLLPMIIIFDNVWSTDSMKPFDNLTI